MRAATLLPLWQLFTVTQRCFSFTFPHLAGSFLVSNCVVQRPTCPRLWAMPRTDACDNVPLWRPDRRRFLTAWLVVYSSVPRVMAIDETDPVRRRPYATTDALVPAVSVRHALTRAMQLASQLRTTESWNDESNAAVLLELCTMCADDQPTKRSATASTPRSDGATAVWETLSGRTVRTALNMYTNNLRYGDSYVLTASPAVRKQWIRSETGLPNVRTVIAADLDLRDLYRNALQTALDDVQAELNVTLSTHPTNVSEVQALLRHADDALTAWLALIDPADVRAAESRRQELRAL